MVKKPLNPESCDTIFAQATAPGKSGVAIIRVSGSTAKSALEALYGAPCPAPRTATLCALKHPADGTPIDNALVLWFPAPHSFTGEDIVEFHTHGSRAVIHTLTRALSSLPGLRMAEPGEFSRRAFTNGKMDLLELEGLADLIEAETSLQQRQALRLLSGELSKLYENWRQEIITLLAKIEAYIDFPDEDLPEALARELLTQAQLLLESLSTHINDSRGVHLRDGFHAVILGAPNVGKSSLLNYLAKRDVAIVSDIAGTTRDVIEVHLDLGGYPLIISDTAGLRERAGQIEGEGIRRALKRAESADIKLVMFDASAKKPDDASLALLDKNCLVIINKTDLSTPSLLERGGSGRGRNNAPQYLEPLKNFNPIFISLRDKAGLEELLARLQECITGRFAPTSDPVFTRERHRAQLTRAAKALERFLKGRGNNAAIELGAEELRHAAHALGSITGVINVDEILGQIFSSFCIGK